ncbi:MAG: glycosyltransferase family 39 protein [Candidatus Sumerlaeota bacterium]|nr:glycosyltransferase family 39 protein [Candidatus Sumerlaeota bacterium]
MNEPNSVNAASRREVRCLWAILALAACLYCVNLGSRDIWDNAGARVMIVAREMAEGGSLFRPNMYGRPRYDKPPLMYWATVLAAATQGRLDVDSAEWVSALSSVAVFFALAATVGVAAGWRAGAMAGLLCALSPGIFDFGRSAQLDSLFAACTTLSLLSFALWILGVGRRPAAWILPAGVALGLAVLAKGPHALTFALAPPVLFLALRRRLNGRAILGILAAAAIGLGVTGVWLLLAHREDPSFFTHIRAVVKNEAVNCNPEPWYYYWKRTLGWTAPWVALLPAIWPRRNEVDLGTRRDALARLFGVACVFGIALLSAIPGKQGHYILPLIPCAMGWMAIRLDARLSAPAGEWAWRQRWILWFLTIAACVLGILAVVGLFLPPRFAPDRPYPFIAAALEVVLGVGGAAMALVAFRRKSLAMAMCGAALTVCVLGFIYYTTVTPVRNANESPRAACAEILRLVGSPANLAEFSGHKEMIDYFLGDRPEHFEADSKNRQWLSRPDPSFLLFFGHREDVDRQAKTIKDVECEMIRAFDRFTSSDRIARLYANPAGAALAKQRQAAAGQ